MNTNKVGIFIGATIGIAAGSAALATTANLLALPVFLTAIVTTKVAIIALAVFAIIGTLVFVVCCVRACKISKKITRQTNNNSTRTTSQNPPQKRQGKWTSEIERLQLLMNKEQANWFYQGSLYYSSKRYQNITNKKALSLFIKDRQEFLNL